MKLSILTITVGSLIFNIFLMLQLFGKSESTFRRNIDSTKPNQQELRELYQFLSPRVFIENANDRLINFVQLRQALTNYQRSLTGEIAFYFEYLPTGVSIGINEKESFVLASLLKVPLVMGVYKAMNAGEIAHNDMLTIGQQNLDAQFGILWKKGVGATLTVDEAIALTLTQSDNTAKSLLMEKVGSKAIEDVYANLDIPLDVETNRPVMTAKNYSSVLRSLYLSSYLPYDQSNTILSFLTQTPFNDKIAANIPAHIKIAHKIGVYVNQQPSESVYTDCGIFYVPKRPYILCVMTKGNETFAQVAMRTISKMIYDYVAAY